MESPIMLFEICGKSYQLSEYYNAIEENCDKLSPVIEILKEFPYTIRNLKGAALKMLKDIPVFIQYKDIKISIYKFIKDNRKFDSQLQLITEISCLERKYEFDLLLEQLKHKDRDQYHAVIIETFRILQDLNFTLNTASFSLKQAFKILHFRSGLVWSDGWEQLWTRSAWLNTAIVLYNSCFDKLIQSVWIGFESFVGYQKNKNGKPMGSPLIRQSLFTKEGLNKIYETCDYNRIKNLLPNNVNRIIEPMYSNELQKIRTYANRIKHRGGMRYQNLFPYGEISEEGDENIYSSYRTEFKDDIDNVIQEATIYHIVFCELVKNVFEMIMAEFVKNGYLTKTNN